MKKILKIMLVILFTISSVFVLTSNVEEIQAAESYPFEGMVNVYSLVIHDEPNFNNDSAVTELIYGTRVKVVGSSGSLYKIIYDGNVEGYTSKNLITNVTNNIANTNIAGIEEYNTYCSNLQKNNFPESYCPYLYYLHAKHPKWIFKADYVDYTLEEASVKEEEKVSLQTLNPNYYIYRDGVPLVNEYVSNGDNYMYINSKAIISLMDPRNSLFDTLIFQFLNLEKNTNVINDAALSRISKSGNLSNYYKEFTTAAEKLNINALHLMARSQQEGADNKNYAPVTGKYTTVSNNTNPDGRTLDGFYNFFNVGSYNSSGYKNPVHRGIAYAAGYIDGNSYGRPWDTPEKAIVGGAEFIGKQYVKAGQNTNYFQKFNVSSYTQSTMFLHQYMTNGYAPMSEGQIMRNAYNAGNLIDSDFEFVIPVYKNMGDNAYQPVDKNSDTTLSSLNVNGKLISGFNKTRTEYAGVNLVTEDNFVTLSVSPNSSLSKISSNDVTFENNTAKINFINGIAKVTFIVTAEDGTKTEYSVEIKQVLPIHNVTVQDVVSKMDVRVNGNYMFGISPGTTLDTLVNTAKKNNGEATITDKDGKSKKDNVLVTGDKITIKGTSESKTYIISVRGDINGDGAVKINDLILLQSHILEKTKLTNEKMYAADINYDSNLKINDLILIQSYILGKLSL